MLQLILTLCLLLSLATINAQESDEIPLLTVLFRVDQTEIDPDYMDNRFALEAIGKLLVTEKISWIDSLKITAYASPEGESEYNLKLSQKRADAVAAYLIRNYPDLEVSRITRKGLGENWRGVTELSKKDPNLPARELVISLLESPMEDDQRETQIKALDQGRPYRYMRHHYFDKLRVGSSVSILFMPDTPMLVAAPAEIAAPEEVFHSEMPKPLLAADIPPYRRAFALKTNLLFDLATLFNLELEVPIGKRWSVMGEWIFPWWGGLGNRGGVSPLPVYSEKLTLQMLSGGLELRYWFKRSQQLDRKAQTWDDYNPLCGWFAGVYGGGGLYDLQFRGDGFQGESYFSAGISTGYAHPISKQLHLEYSVGFGYLETEYRRYEPIDGHKVWVHDGRTTWIGPTKAKIALVWIPRWQKK